jgi:hypothetical protein
MTRIHGCPVFDWLLSCLTIISNVSLPKKWYQQEDKSLYAELKSTRREYIEAAAAYDAALSDAHRAAQGTPEKVGHLKRARAIADEMMAALKRYQAVVVQLTELYSTAPINGRGTRK